MSLYERIPNNVDLSNDKRLLRALEHWLPNYMQWWSDMGPEGFQADDVYLRTATSVEPGGWAHFDYVKMPDYRWGIFLAPPEHDRRVGFGDHMGLPVWQEVPGEYRNMLRRLIVTQGDTEPASVEQQRLLGQSAPSLYDLRNLFQVNVEEGRHLWAMVYLLHSYFGRDGREESEELLERRSGSSDKPRILEAFNEPIEDWLSFYMFTTFTDRDGKYELLALAESRSTCSRLSPIAMASTSCWRWRKAASIRSRAPRASCSPKRRITCSSANRACGGWCGAPARSCAKPATTMCAARARSICRRCRSISTCGSASACTCSAAKCPAMPPTSSAR